MLIGILQAGHFPEDLVPTSGTYSDLYARLLDGHGLAFKTWSVVDNIFPDSAVEADGWLITGSRHGAYEDLPWIKPLEALIRDIRDSGRPLVGVCFGHQVIAQAFGGKVAKFDGGWSVGRTEYDFDGNTVALNAWHQDQVVERPADARVIGRSDFCENAALAYGDQIFSVQPHPEFSATEVEGLVRTRGANLPEPVRASAQAGLGQPTDNVDFGHRIAQFFLTHRRE